MQDSPFDNVRFKIPRSILENLARNGSSANFESLSGEHGVEDPVIRSLAEALVPALDRREPADRLFIDYVMLALHTHISEHYGGVIDSGKQQHGLTTRQLKCATAYLSGNSGRDVRVNEVAAHCGLSVSYFIKAFKRATGRTPHRWLLEYRTRRSLDMLQGDQSIAEIAVACNFADQAHFSRVFKQIYGTNPGNWRRQQTI